jgi:hypothetical protein
MHKTVSYATSYEWKINEDKREGNQSKIMKYKGKNERKRKIKELRQINKSK